jgi:hypothetical protein
MPILSVFLEGFPGEPRCGKMNGLHAHFPGCHDILSISLPEKIRIMSIDHRLFIVAQFGDEYRLVLRP